MIYIFISVVLINNPQLGVIKETKEIHFKKLDQCLALQDKIMAIKPTLDFIVVSALCKESGII